MFNSKALVLIVATLMASAAISWAQSVGGLPAKPRFQSIGVNSAAPATGGITASGAITGATLAGAYAATGLTGTINQARLPFIVARGQINVVGGLSNSTNVTSSARTGVGQFNANLAAAGFGAAPLCVCGSTGGVSPGATCSAPSATQVIVSTYDTAGASADIPTAFICIGT